MKDRQEDITILSSFQLKKVRTILRAWLDFNEIIEETIKKAQDVCGRRWYDVDNIMEILHFPTMDLIENAYPPKLMIEKVEHRCDEAKEKIQCLDHISIEDMDRLIRQPLAIEARSTFLSAFGTIWLKTRWKILSWMPNQGLSQQIIPTQMNC